MTLRPDLERLRQRLRAEGVRHIPRGPHHVSAILGKFGVAAREEAGRVALKLGLGPEPARDGEVVKPT